MNRTRPIGHIIYAEKRSLDFNPFNFMNARELKEPRKKMQNLEFYTNIKTILKNQTKSSTKKPTVDSQ